MRILWVQKRVCGTLYCIECLGHCIISLEPGIALSGHLCLEQSIADLGHCIDYEPRTYHCIVCLEHCIM